MADPGSENQDQYTWIRRYQNRLAELQERLDDANSAREQADTQLAHFLRHRGELYYKGSLLKLEARLEELPADHLVRIGEVEVYTVDE